MNDGSQTIEEWRGKFIRVMRNGRWEYADRIGTTGAVAIVAVTEAGRLILTEQFRIPVGKRVLELPAGLAGDEPGSPGEAFAEAARRELLEETGYAATEMVWLAEGPPSAGLGSEIVTFYAARGLHREHGGGGHGGENIQVHEVALAELDAWLAARQEAGVLVDPKIFAGLYLIQKRMQNRLSP
jgi:ADP-ribose pyrophosphatase